MNKIKTYALSALALSGLFLIGSLMHSRDSQAKGATYSTPVMMMNTNAQPGSILDAERATRIPYQSTSLKATGACGPNPAGACGFTFSPAPAGYRLVVENVAGTFELNLASPVLSGVLLGPFSGARFGLSAPLGGQNPFEAVSGLNQNLLAYFDPGEVPSVFMYGNFFVGGGQSVTVTGHLENCGLTGCPAIQH